MWAPGKIIQVAANNMSLHTVGLKAGGTVVAVGYNEYGQLNVGSCDRHHTGGGR